MAPNTTDRLNRQVAFILEIDRLKSVLRRSYLIESRRAENSAEHSWHVGVLAAILAEHADHTIDISRVILMLLVHDIIEVEAGDTFLYDEAGNRDKAKREAQAADAMFGILPEAQGKEVRGYWEEYEARETPEAKFAYAMDRFMPLLHNYHTQGKSWQEHNIKVHQVLEANGPIQEGSATLWAYASDLIHDAVAKGYLAKD